MSCCHACKEVTSAGYNVSSNQISLCSGVNGCFMKIAEILDVVRDIPVARKMTATHSPCCEIQSTHARINFVKSLWPSKKKEKYDQESLVKGHDEPCLVWHVFDVVAGCKGISDIDQLSVALYQNTCRHIFDVVAGCKGISDIDQLSAALYQNTCRVSSIMTWMLQQILFLLVGMKLNDDG